jgi:phosphate transport system permease protein
VTLGFAFVLILLIAAAIGGISYVRAGRLRTGGRLHSLPAYHAAHAVIWILAPALLVLAAWAPMQSRLVDQAVLASPEGQALPDFEMQRDTILAEARQIANREIEAGFNPESTALAPRVKEAERRYASIGGIAATVFALSAAGGVTASSAHERPSSDG